MSAAMMNRIRTLEIERQQAWNVVFELLEGADEPYLELFTLASSGPCDEAKARQLEERHEAKMDGVLDALDRVKSISGQIEALLARQPVSGQTTGATGV